MKKVRARRELPKAVREFRKQDPLYQWQRQRLAEQVAYTWFNRFTALQYMDMNGYNRVRVIAPARGSNQARDFIRGKCGCI